MTDPLRHPVFAHQPLPVPKRAQAALDAAAIWLCQSGELLRVYQVWPDFQQRSDNLHKILAARMTEWLGQRKGETRTNFACHCHTNIVSIALQLEEAGDQKGCADKTIPLRLFWDEEELN